MAARNDNNRKEHRNAFNVAARRLGWFLVSFYVIWALLTGLMSYARIATAENPPLLWPEIAIIVIIAAAITVGIALPLAFGIVEGIPMVLAKLHTDRVREKAHQEGRREGREERDRLWREWNQRRVQAEREGVAFDEPTPDAIVTE